MIKKVTMEWRGGLREEVTLPLFLAERIRRRERQWKKKELTAWAAAE